MDLDNEELEETRKLPCNKIKYKVVYKMKKEYDRTKQKKEDKKIINEENER